jgi:hypothetical protein
MQFVRYMNSDSFSERVGCIMKAGCAACQGEGVPSFLLRSHSTLESSEAVS